MSAPMATLTLAFLLTQMVNILGNEVKVLPFYQYSKVFIRISRKGMATGGGCIYFMFLVPLSPLPDPLLKYKNKINIRIFPEMIYRN